MKRNLLFIIFCLSVFAGTLSAAHFDNEEDAKLIEDNGDIAVEESTVTETEGMELELDLVLFEKATLQGKLKMKGLPLSPSIKIFMERDSLIDISLRAPFVGEAGRAVITPDTLVVVNKMSKTYIAESLRNVLGGKTPSDSVASKSILSINDIQDLLLGRFFLPGIDLETVEFSDVMDIYPDEEEKYNVVPKGEAEIENVTYGFVVDRDFVPLMMVLLPQYLPDVEIDVFYTYKLKGYDLKAVYQKGNKALDLTLELKDPEWNGEKPNGIEIGNKFRKVNFEEFMRGM